MDELITLKKLDEIYFKVECDNPQALVFKNKFSFFVPNYQFHPKYKRNIWNGKICFFDYTKRMLPIGLLPDFDKICQEMGYRYKVEKNPFTSFLTPDETEEYLDLIFMGTGITPRTDQKEIIKRAFKYGRGVAVSPTGSGKSLILYSIVRILSTIGEKKILIIVPNVSLVIQLFKDFLDYGWKNASDHCEMMFSGEKPSFDKNILISTWQSLRKRPDELFCGYSSILVDETHGAKGVEIQKILKKCTRAKFRFGCTGTLPEDISEKKNIFGFIGPKIYESNYKDLQEKGILAKIVVANLFLKYPENIIKKNRDLLYQEEVDFIRHFPNRMTVFNKIIDTSEKGKNSLVLCNTIEHLNDIYNYMTKCYSGRYTILKIHGAVPAGERERIRHLTENIGNVIIVATYGTMAIGVNIKRLHNIIFATSYKSKIRVLQSIGRGLRLHDSKDKLIVYDLVDDLRYKTKNGKIEENYAFQHFRKRLQFYKDQGYKYKNTVIQM